MEDLEISLQALVTIERVVGAIRAELGEDIDAYPGCRSPEGADPLNRAFRAIVASLLSAAWTLPGDIGPHVSRALLLVASRRLASEGRAPGLIKALIEDEPGGPDDWLAFLILSSPAQIEPLLDPDRP